MSNRVFKLQDFAEVVSTSVKPEDASNYERFVGLEHYDAGEPVITRYTDTSLLVSAVKEFKENDILIARRNVYLKRAGIVFFSGVTSGDSIILRIPDTCIDKTGIAKELAVKIIPFVLNSEHFWAYANKHADGMNSKRISKDTLLEYEFELSSNELEEAKSEKLWAAYRLKESYKRLLAATDEMVKSQFIEMTSKCQSSVKLSSIATYSIGLTYAPEDVNSDGIIVLRSGNIQDGSITLEDIVRVNKPIKDSLYVKKGNILMCSRNGSASLVGKTAIVGDYPERMTFGAFMTLIKTDIPEYINAFFSTPSFRNQVSMGKSSTMNQITQKMLDSIELPLVSVSEQEQFAEIVRQADKSKFELKRAIEAIDKVIKSLING